MSARTSSEAPPVAILEQVLRDQMRDQQVKAEINEILLKIKNGSIWQRVCAKLYKGRGYNDGEHANTIVWYMFGTSGKKMVPKRPQFDYPANVRHMSLYDLEAALIADYDKKKARHTSPTYRQLQRIFKGLKSYKLVENFIEREHHEASGHFRAKSSYSFNIQAWRDLLAECDRATPFKQGKRRQPKAATSRDASVGPQHRAFRGQRGVGTEVAKKTSIDVVFLEPPCDSSRVIIPSYKGELVSLPGSGGSSLRAGSADPVPLAEQKKELAQPATGFPLQEKTGPFLTSLSKDQEAALEERFSRQHAVVQLKADLETNGNRYLDNPHRHLNKADMPGWEILLKDIVGHKLSNLPGWERDLYAPGDTDKVLTLQPRIPDCFLVSRMEGLTGVQPFDGPFIHLSPEEMAAGNLAERFTACPLRVKDWRQLTRLMRRPATDKSRLTNAGLRLMCAAFKNAPESFSIGWNSVVYNHLTVVPEAGSVDISDYYLELFEFEGQIAEGVWKDLLPFMHWQSVSPTALLSAGNAGKLLFNWDRLWSALQTATSKPRVNRLASISAVAPDADVWWRIPTDELPQRVATTIGLVLAKSPLLGIGAGVDQKKNIDISYDLSQLAAIAQRPGGVRSLAPAPRAVLCRTMLRLYCALPHVWCDLEGWLGTEAFRDAMPVGCLDDLRTAARARVVLHVAEHWQVPYVDHDPFAL